MPRRIKIAVQKKGRLTKPSLEYLKSLGLKFDQMSLGLLVECSNFPVDILMIRNMDIARLVNTGIADVGITGMNVLLEKNEDVKILQPLKFADCSLVIASPQNSNIDKVSDLAGLRIATSYPNILRRYLIKNNVTSKIIKLNGSVEIGPALGLCDAICDITETGKTLRANNLKIIAGVLTSQAVLVVSRNVVVGENNFLDILKARYEGVC